MREEEGVVAQAAEESVETAPAAAEQTAETEKKTPRAPRKPRAEKKQPAGAADAKIDFRGAEYGTVEKLVEAYNDMVPTAVDLGMKKVGTVTTFADVKVGARACEQLHAAILKARDVAAQPAKKSKTSTQPAKGNSKETTDMARKTAAKTKTTRKTAKQATAKKAASTGARSARFDKDSKITIVGKENPKRSGTEQHARFAKLMKAGGKTVGDYLKSGESTTLRHAVEIGFAKVS